MRPHALDGAQIGERADRAQRGWSGARGERRGGQEAALDAGAVRQEDGARREVALDELEQRRQAEPAALLARQHLMGRERAEVARAERAWIVHQRAEGAAPEDGAILDRHPSDRDDGVLPRLETGGLEIDRQQPAGGSRIRHGRLLTARNAPRGRRGRCAGE